VPGKTSKFIEVLRQPLVLISKPLNVMTTQIITFSPDGTAGAYGLKLCHFMNSCRLEIHRATKIEFNNASQHWELKDRKGRVRFFAKARSACLDWEQHNLQPE
jgi:hypothetical protein